jgi:hypothetical protein
MTVAGRDFRAAPLAAVVSIQRRPDAGSCSEVQLADPVRRHSEARQQRRANSLPHDRDYIGAAAASGMREATFQRWGEALPPACLKRTKFVQNHIVGLAVQPGKDLCAGPAKHRLVEDERPDCHSQLAGSGGGGGGGARCAASV